MKKLSIIIVTYNNEKDIHDCISSIKQYSDLPLEDIELIIVDNNSRNPKPMFDQLRKEWDDIIIIRNTRNGGYGQGNNLGLRSSHAPIALIMNPDVRMMEPIFKEGISQFERNPHLGLLGLKQMLSRTLQSRSSFSCHWLTNGYLRTILCSVCTRFDWYLPSIMCVQGSCFFLRKQMFESIGMFDEQNFLYGEEEDIHYRMKSRFGSGSSAYRSDLHYIHLTLQRERTFEYERNMVDANVRLYERKGVDGLIILRHYLQNVKFQHWKFSLRKSTKEYAGTLARLEDYIIEEIKKRHHE